MCIAFRLSRWVHEDRTKRMRQFDNIWHQRTRKVVHVITKVRVVAFRHKCFAKKDEIRIIRHFMFFVPSTFRPGVKHWQICIISTFRDVVTPNDISLRRHELTKWQKSTTIHSGWICYINYMSKSASSTVIMPQVDSVHHKENIATISYLYIDLFEKTWLRINCLIDNFLFCGLTFEKVLY